MDCRKFVASSSATAGSASGPVDALPEIPFVSRQNSIPRLLAVARIIAIVTITIFSARSSHTNPSAENPARSPPPATGSAFFEATAPIETNCAFVGSAQQYQGSLKNGTARPPPNFNNGANVDVFNRGVSQLFGVVKCGQTIESIIGNFRNSDVRFARVCMGLRRKMRFGQNAKQ